MADKKVVMVGGRRTGKSTILASMIQQMATDPELTSKYLQMKQSKGTGNSSSVSLDQKRISLQQFITGNLPGRLYTVDFHADDSFNSYIVKNKIPNGKGGSYFGNIKIEYVDCPGESYSEQSEAREKVEDHFRTSDIFIIAVDTPYLMDEDSNAGYFTMVNQVNQILSLFQQNIVFKDDDDFKKVIFVPVKCEKWANKIDEVTKKLQRDSYYGPLIQYLSKNPRFSVSIIPAFTAGNIEFAEFGEPLITVETKEMCSPISDDEYREYRFTDGKTDYLASGDKAIKNEKFLDMGIPFYSWFKNKKQEYSPKNCDQLALHIWRFIVYKTQIEVDKSIFPAWLINFPSIKNMLEAIRKMQTGGLLKDSGEGILNINLVEKV